MVEQEMYRRAMVVVAHADDAEFGCSGTVALWARQGAEVIYVICTDGSKGSGDPEMTSSRLVEIRRQEQLDAARVLGVKEVVFLGYEDAILQPTLELRRDICRQIRRYKPQVLICMSPVRDLESASYLGHPDHFASAEAALSAVFPAARDRLTFPELMEEGLEPHKVEEVLVMSRTNPNKWIDVTDTLDIAMEAIKCHRSQVNPEDVGNFLRGWREEMGKERGMKYAEAFRHFQLR
ncbi:MAG: PIG-L family deacetylase [Chloroflexi bacterium]|nr:PIG-L family deacetylase [Chloroflexota bacterium]